MHLFESIKNHWFQFSILKWNLCCPPPPPQPSLTFSYFGDLRKSFVSSVAIQSELWHHLPNLEIWFLQSSYDRLRNEHMQILWSTDVICGIQNSWRIPSGSVPRGFVNSFFADLGQATHFTPANSGLVLCRHISLSFGCKLDFFGTLHEKGAVS
jgi:hypothetical protein